MTADEKLAIQTVLIEALNAKSVEQPTLLVDALVGGQGHGLVYHILSSQEHAARVRADTLTHLLKEFVKDSNLSADPPDQQVA